MKNMIKAIAALTAVAAALSFASCAKKAPETKLQQIKKAGKIILGTSADYPPYEFHGQVDGQDAIIGFDIEIAKEVAKDLGVELEIKDMDFDGLLAALKAGTIDIIISGMTPTEERKQSVDFSEIYYYVEHGVIIRKADEAKYAADVASLKDAPIGAQLSTIQVKLAKKYIKGVADDQLDAPNDQIKEVAKLSDLVMEVKNSKIEAVVAELPVAKAYIAANPDLMLASYTFKDDDGGNAIAVNKGEADLLAEVNKTLAHLMSDGKVDQFIAEANAKVNEE